VRAVILAGGLGTRLSEETETRPKPMVEIGGQPILWHILKCYSQHGIDEFVICLGYKGYVVKEYFANYFLHTADCTFDLKNNRLEVHESHAEPWRVTLVETGLHTQTGARLRKIRRYVDDEPFCFTYGDALADVAIDRLVDFHHAHGKWATVTAVQPPGRFGALDLDGGGAVSAFTEKPLGDGAWINGGFFVLSPEVFDVLGTDENWMWEQEPMRDLVSRHQLEAFTHGGFWQPMDTLRDRHRLEELWAGGDAPWAEGWLR
jgi:glucose-1-phosphate cytidylyltransferase